MADLGDVVGVRELPTITDTAEGGRAIEWRVLKAMSSADSVELGRPGLAEGEAAFEWTSAETPMLALEPLRPLAET